MVNKASKVSVEKKPFTKRLLSLTGGGKYNAWEVWSDFITVFSIAISNAVDKRHAAEREESYARAIRKYNQQERDVFPALIADMVTSLDANPEQDFLGSVFMELELGNDHAGQFFTPYDVCRCMALLTMCDSVDKIEKRGYITINDSACGAGATLIAAINEVEKKLHDAGKAMNWQNHVLVYAQDIDYTVGMMCYIQLSLLGVAAIVKIGNSLTDPMRTGDTQDNHYWYTPMYFSPVWSTRRALAKIDELFKEVG